MADFRKAFDEARNGSKSALQKKIENTKENTLDNITGNNLNNEDSNIGKAKKAVEQTKKTIEFTKKTAQVISNIISFLLNGIIFLFTTPVGWVIDALIIAVIILSIMLTTVGRVEFDTTCPIDPSTGKIYSGKDCEIYGDGSKKGRLSSDGDNGGDNNAGGTGDWAKNRTGKVPYRSFNAWRPSNLPADLKKYAINPSSVGMSYRNSKGWTQGPSGDWGNCTDLTASLMWALWEKVGQHPSQQMGHGREVVGKWVAKFGGSSTTIPTAGAAFSSPATATNGYGHTGVVSHVFENDDILIIEQNYSTLSGTFQGFGPYSWNYRYVPKSEYSAGWSFYDPSRVGYKIVSSARSM